MKLRFEVDQAEAFRRGVDVPKSIVSIEVNPAELPQAERDLIADRLDGIDVCQLHLDVSGKRIKSFNPLSPEDWQLGKQASPERIRAALPTYEELIAAIRREEMALNGSPK